MKIKSILSLMSLVAIGAVAAVSYAQSNLGGLCDNAGNERPLCLRMINLRSQIFALETQRELMQVNPELVATIGRGLVKTANEALVLVGIGIPEHRQGLSGVILMSEQMIAHAEKQDGQMMVMANSMRTNCASCHNADPSPGHAGWGEIFRRDWSEINKICNEAGKNPYLCKSMYGMLSTHSYHHTAYEADIRNFEMTRESAREILRILGDLKAKGFNHLPEDKRNEAVKAAREVVLLADAHDVTAFEKAKNIVNACMNCHASINNGDRTDPWRPSPFQQ